MKTIGLILLLLLAVGYANQCTKPVAPKGKKPILEQCLRRIERFPRVWCKQPNAACKESCQAFCLDLAGNWTYASCHFKYECKWGFIDIKAVWSTESIIVLTFGLIVIFILLVLICCECLAWCNRTRTVVVDYPEPAYGDLLARHEQEVAEFEAVDNRPLVVFEEEVEEEEMVE